MPKIVWKIGVRKERKERKGGESAEKMVTGHKATGKSYKERVGAVLTGSSVKILRKRHENVNRGGM